jgi:site-specific DNA-cytosine methylase
MKVISLFDGISCGRVALERCGFDVETYDAFEIENDPIKISLKNYPDIIQHGSVVGADFTRFKGYDLLMGGSPCQGFSFAGERLNFEDERSALFFEFVRALKEIEPKYFLLENVKMPKNFEKVITEHLGVEPVLINSNLVSAQNRQRLYWTNIPDITLPEDRGILLKDILEDDKGSYPLSKRHYDAFLKSYPSWKESPLEGKSKPILASYYKQPPHCPYVKSDFTESGYRRLTPVECERLQTLPDNYTEGVSDSARYKMIGNGWTVDVISHILKNIVE